jgi:hypothetical protein
MWRRICHSSAHHLVRDHHRLLEQRHFQRGRAGCHQHRIGRRDRGMRLAVQQLDLDVLQAGLRHQLQEVLALALAGHRRDKLQRAVALPAAWPRRQTPPGT